MYAPNQANFQGKVRLEIQGKWWSLQPTSFQKMTFHTNNYPPLQMTFTMNFITFSSLEDLYIPEHNGTAKMTPIVMTVS